MESRKALKGIGIVSERPTNNEILFSKRYQCEEILSDKNPFELVVVWLPVSVDRLGNLPERKIRRLIEKGKASLKKIGVEDVILSDGLRNFPEGVSGFTERRNRLFLELMPDLIKFYGNKCSLEFPLERICIRDERLDRISEKLVTEITYLAKAVTVCTGELGTARIMRDRIFDSTGLYVSLCSHLAKGEGDVFIDAQGPSVRIGRDLCFDHLDLGFDLGGCNADNVEIATFIGDVDWCRNRLTEFLGKIG